MKIVKKSSGPKTTSFGALGSGDLFYGIVSGDLYMKVCVKGGWNAVNLSVNELSTFDDTSPVVPATGSLVMEN